MAVSIKAGFLVVSELRKSYQKRHPEFPWLEAGQSGDVEAMLHRLGWIDADEHVLSAEKAGEGNMNLTLRVRTPRRTFILKQSRPWVEKYDHIEAPWDRIHAEQSFYQRVERIPALADSIPLFLGADLDSRLLLLEDLAPARDLTGVYGGTKLVPSTLASLARFLRILHQETAGEARPEFFNREMKALNHAHIFELPMTGELDLPLDSFEPGLSAAAEALQQRTEVVERIREAGARYLGEGSCLVHGDYFPGSWLLTEQGPRIIDPEFCYYGDSEFDLGVAVAHLALGRLRFEDASEFMRSAGAADREARWIARYAAAEVIRRLIGVAQLPIAETERWRAGMLEQASTVALNDDWTYLWS
jgi:5-methylthioribose kinase